MNADEMGLTTVKNPGKIVAQKGVKQVGAVTSGQRVNLVTLSCAVNVFGNSIVPMFVFPRLQYLKHIVDVGPPGCIGASHKSDWMTLANFLIFLHRVSEKSANLSFTLCVSNIHQFD